MTTRPASCSVGFGASLLALLLSACPAAVEEAGGGAARSALWFEDATADVGVDFVHFNGMSGRNYMAEMMGAGLALLDYDNDGDLDLLLLQGTMMGEGIGLEQSVLEPPAGHALGDRLYRNELVPTGTLSFVDVTVESELASHGYAMGVATGDYDNDGDVDLYLTNFGANAMYSNDGDGTFTPTLERAGTDDRRWSVPAVFFDYDGDGWLDLFVGNYVAFRTAANKRCESELGHLDYCSPHAYANESDRLFRNNGDGTFADVTRKAGLTAAFGAALGAAVFDYDGDGRLDLYVANDGVANQLWLNNGDGTFRDSALLSGCAVNATGAAEASMGVIAEDLDQDGDEDLILTHLRGETNTVYINGPGGFEDRTSATGLGATSQPWTGFGIVAEDFDLDGALDLAVVNGAVTNIDEQHEAGDPLPLKEPNQLFKGGGDGSFELLPEEAAPSFALLEVGRGLAVGDLDNDGDGDLVLSNNAGPARVLLNRIGDGRPWIGVRILDGRRRDAYGARVGIEDADGKTVWGRVRTAGSYVSARDPRLRFAAPGATTRTVVVRWPGGGGERWPGLATGVYHELVRGTGEVVGAGE